MIRKKAPVQLSGQGLCCRGRARTFTGKLATGQEENFSGQPVILRLSFTDNYRSIRLVRSESPPPRQEGLSANFNTLHCVLFNKVRLLQNINSTYMTNIYIILNIILIL